jgi:phosphomannomutase
VARELRERNADLGLWIDGQGAACRLVDEQGRIVDRGQLCAMLASYVCRQRPAPTLVVGQPASRALMQTLNRLGARVVRGGSTRQSMSETLRSSAADFGASGEGEFWYPHQAIAPDALLTLSLLLTCLSESDRPLSEVLDAV